MHYLTIVFIVWAVAATVLLALLAYRSTLTRYEEDCLFLGDCNEHQHKEQESILARVRKVQPAVRVMTVATCLMSAALVGTFIFQLVQQLKRPAYALPPEAIGLRRSREDLSLVAPRPWFVSQRLPRKLRRQAAVQWGASSSLSLDCTSLWMVTTVRTVPFAVTSTCTVLLKCKRVRCGLFIPHST